jgi:peptide/histidine transporter 3/4
MAGSPQETPKGEYADGSHAVMIGANGVVYKNKFLSVCSFILIMELCERLAYYTMQTNLSIFIQKHLGTSPAKASMITGLFNALVYVTPLLGAYIADVKLGRYMTIMSFSMVYIVGLYGISIASWPTIESGALFYISLFGLICIGAGGIKSNVVTMGADQFNPLTELRQMESFFNWFYWMINVGSLIATLWLANFALNGGLGISSYYSFSASFFLAAILFTIALAAFWLGRNRYYKAPADGSAMAKFVKIVFFAAKTSTHGKVLLFGFFLLLLGIIINVILTLLGEGDAHQVLSYVNGALIFVGVILNIGFGRNVDWVEAARAANGGRWADDEVDGAWEVLRLFPYLGFQISFWTVYNNMGGPWNNQGCQMDCRVWSSEQYNPGSWSFWDTISIVLLVPVFDKVIYPAWGKVQGKTPTALQKIGVGYLIAIICMVISGIVEIFRRDADVIPGLYSICGADGENRPVNDLSLWWQMPQYFLLGIGEILASITAYDLFYNQVPQNMKSVCQGLNLLTTALGGTVNLVIQNIFVKETPQNLNEGHQEYLYFTMAAYGAISLALFIVVSRSFVYKEAAEGDSENEYRKSSYQRSIEARSSIIG